METPQVCMYKDYTFWLNVSCDASKPSTIHKSCRHHLKPPLVYLRRYGQTCMYVYHQILFHLQPTLTYKHLVVPKQCLAHVETYGIFFHLSVRRASLVPYMSVSRGD